MFRPKKMRKVRMIVLRSRVEAVIKDLHEAGLVDIRKSKYEGLEEGRPLPEFDTISTELLRMRGAYSIMEPFSKKAGGEPELIKDPMAEARSYDAPERLKALSNDMAAASDRLRSLDSESALVARALWLQGDRFQQAVHKDTRLQGRRSAGLEGSPKLREQLDKIGQSTLVSAEGSGSALVLFPKKDQQAVESALSDAGFSEFQVPQGMTTALEAQKRIDSERKEAQADLEGG